ncbi:MAG: FtsQ-type POTRA domain-containing protein [Armatimonadota bacterium]|nr:FtsQ-type POTRA domain-containing protein [Armatimonadota bacterium]MDR7519267.1 FtsQ-type POTRA domain-containing protein [Armatimonadota bacterium]MDR7549747.1 FtsQ-type POTRA domain-containing protein [Armatimonadota bacterium]
MPSTDPSPRRPPSLILGTLSRFAVIMAALLAAAAFPQSALFTIERIEVTGARSLPDAAVAALAGLEPGMRLFAVDAEAVVTRLRADPRIKDADVRLRPPRTVVLHITERRPVLALDLGDRFALLDEDLVVVALTADAAGAPEVVDGLGGTPWVLVGARVASPAARIALAGLPDIPQPLRAQLRRITVTPGPDLTLLLRSGLEIKAGAPAGLAERLAQVPGVVTALRARGIVAQTLDLRYAGSIAVRRAPPAAVKGGTRGAGTPDGAHRSAGGGEGR